MHVSGIIDNDARRVGTFGSSVTMFADIVRRPAGARPPMVSEDIPPSVAEEVLFVPVDDETARSHCRAVQLRSGTKI
jgi:hypothetical protein